MCACTMQPLVPAGARAQKMMRLTKRCVVWAGIRAVSSQGRYPGTEFSMLTSDRVMGCGSTNELLLLLALLGLPCLSCGVFFYSSVISYKDPVRAGLLLGTSFCTSPRARLSQRRRDFVRVIRSRRALLISPSCLRVEEPSLRSVCLETS